MTLARFFSLAIRGLLEAAFMGSGCWLGESLTLCDSPPVSRSSCMRERSSSVKLSLAFRPRLR